MTRLSILQKKRSKLIVGLISGTSVDGIDAALVRVNGSGVSTRVTQLAFDTYQYPPELRALVLRNSLPGTGTVDLICELNILLAHFFADAVKKIARKARVPLSEIDLIGSHGQTVHHLPVPKRGLMPSFSTIAPASAAPFFERLLEIKRRYYTGVHFQFQFSLHTTDQTLRDQIIPVKKWSFSQMAEYGARFYQPGDRKITLNFALAQGNPLEPHVLLEYFTPEKFLVKITPLNSTYRARENRLASYIDPCQPDEQDRLVEALRQSGYEVIVSIGEVEENAIGSNCGQYLRRHLNATERLEDGYCYEVRARDYVTDR